MKLTAQDLQIGDWVLYNNEPNIIAEVSEIIQGEAEVCFAVSNYMANIDEIKPFPITPEILENNGFEKLEEKYYRRFLEEKGYYESVRVYFDEEPNVAVRVLDGSEFKGRIKYIHELQQAMRLCNIKGKEIKL